jgi:6-phosphogluconolactonase
MPNYLDLGSRQEMAHAAAHFIAKSIGRIQNRKFRLALSGGNTPPLVFRELDKLVGSHFDPDQLMLFWVDERCVPIENNLSNAGSARKHMKQIWDRAQIMRIDGSMDPVAAAHKYQSTLLALNGINTFDLALLGVGADGHVASLFPGSTALDSEALVEPTKAPDGSNRISVTLPVLAGTSGLLVLATGYEKATAIRATKFENHSADSPFRRAIWEHNSAYVIMDRKAASFDQNHDNVKRVTAQHFLKMAL